LAKCSENFCFFRAGRKTVGRMDERRPAP